MVPRAFDSIRRVAAAVRARLGGDGPNAEVVVRTADAFPIAAHWIGILGDHGVRARLGTDLVSGFMGDGGSHRIIVRAADAERAAEILDALWPDESDRQTP